MVAEGMRACPAVAACAVAQWKGGHPTIAWMFSQGAWRRIPCHRGSWQGSRLSQALFVCSLESAQTKAENAARAEEREQAAETSPMPSPFRPLEGAHQPVVEDSSAGGPVSPPACGHIYQPADMQYGAKPVRARVALQDDTTHVGRAGALRRLWPHLIAELEAAGHKLRPPKCACWIPGYDEVPTTGLPQIAQQLLALVPRQTGGVDILGSAATAQHRMHAGSSVDAPAATWDRLSNAEKLLEKVVAMAQAQPDHKSFAKAWSLFQKCCGSTLDYDMRVVPPPSVRQPSEKLAAMLRRGLERILAEPLTDSQWRQCALPTVFGGMALRAAAPTLHAAASYWCSVDAHMAVLPAVARQLGMPQAKVHPEREHAERARKTLLEAGVAVDWGGIVAVTQSMREAYVRTPWKEDVPVEEVTRAQPRRRDPAPSVVQLGALDRYLSRVCRALEASAAAELWQGLDTEGKSNLLSSGGTGTGTTFTRVARSPNEILPNAHWRQCVLSR